ncbi:MAG TPA: hypothetical protein VE604_16455 [Candidatus Polarisedimenticolia bacterium]|nr:hypothetical protein [Candidatus Polarisedimenticolia bacterium]
MPANNAARLLNKLEQARSQIGTMKERELVRLLSAAGRVTFGKDAKSLIRFHDLLLFFRAFPPGLAVLRLSERLLESFEPRGKAALAGGADADDFAPEEVVGIAGTVVEATFSYPMVCWLVQRHAKSISIQWDDYDRETQRAVIWPRFFPLVEEDSLTEANVPYLEWLKAARGRQDELPWLVRQFQRLPLSEKEKAALYDSLEIMVRWDMSSSRASRTLSRKPVKEFYFHREPLIQRRQVSLTDEFAKPRLPIKVLPPREAEKMLDLVKEATGVRYRELYGTSNADPKWVAQANPGRGVEIYFWGLPPEMRLPLRAYLAGFSVKNGVPINYVECISLFDWTEIGFNTFPAYRDGETAWIYAQTLRLLRQWHGTNAISVYPYQIGDGNEEAIGSGAFWFYRKMGFRSMNPELEKAAQSEEKKVRTNASYRTPARTLRRLSKAHVVYELPEADRGAWDRFAMRNVGFAAQRRMARDFDGDAEAMRKAAVTWLARIITVDPQKLKPQALGAFSDFATVLSLVPDVSRWSSDDKDALREIIAAKAGPNELRYQRLLQSHPRLRAAILRLGSQKL